MFQILEHWGEEVYNMNINFLCEKNLKNTVINTFVGKRDVI